MKLSIRALALTAGLLGGGVILFVALANLASPEYGRSFLQLCSSVYPGYDAAPAFGSVIIGALYGFADGAIAGAVFAWLYNTLAGNRA